MRGKGQKREEKLTGLFPQRLCHIHPSLTREEDEAVMRRGRNENRKEPGIVEVVKVFVVVFAVSCIGRGRWSCDCKASTLAWRGCGQRLRVSWIVISSQQGKRSGICVWRGVAACASVQRHCTLGRGWCTLRPLTDDRNDVKQVTKQPPQTRSICCSGKEQVVSCKEVEKVPRGGPKGNVARVSDEKLLSSTMSISLA